VNSQIVAQLAASGVPMRAVVTSGILHWKMMLFAGQQTVEFGSANYSPQAFVPIAPYANYVAESVYYTDDPSIVDSFKRRFDDAWIDTVSYANYANISGPLVRTYPKFAVDPDLNFPPLDNFATRAVSAYNAERTAIDAIVFRVTDRRHADALFLIQPPLPRPPVGVRRVAQRVRRLRGGRRREQGGAAEDGDERAEPGRRQHAAGKSEAYARAHTTAAAENICRL
jgi:hypothetical protein